MRWLTFIALMLLAFMAPANAQQDMSPAAQRNLPAILAAQRNEATNRAAAIAADRDALSEQVDSLSALGRWRAEYIIGLEQQEFSLAKWHGEYTNGREQQWKIWHTEYMIGREQQWMTWFDEFQKGLEQQRANLAQVQSCEGRTTTQSCRLMIPGTPGEKP